MSETVSSSAPGKLVLLGEYAVLRGAPAVVAAVDRRAQVEIGPPEGAGESPDGAPALVVDAPQLGVRGARVSFSGDDAGADPSLGVVRAVVAELEEAHGLQRRLGARRVSIDTSSFFEAPRGGSKLGIGSSAAVAAALTAGLCRAAGLELPRDEVFRLALAAHRRAQGPQGSGVDLAASVYGGVTTYRIDRPPQPVALPAGFGFVALYTGKAAETPGLVRRVLGAVDSDPRAAEAFASLCACAEAGAEAAGGGDGDRLLERVRAFADAYRALGDAAGIPLWSEAHAAIAAVVQAAGCVYKPSGAGGGDLGLAFYRSPAVLGSLEAALADGLFETVPLAVADAGSTAG